MISSYYAHTSHSPRKMIEDLRALQKGTHVFETKGKTSVQTYTRATDPPV